VSSMWILLLGCAPKISVDSPVEAVMTAAPVLFDRQALVGELVAAHGEASRARAERGVSQVAALWRAEDGDLAAFVRQAFLSDPAQLDATFARLERVLEQLDGHFNEMGRELRWATDLDLGPLLPVDPLLASVDPSAHSRRTCSARRWRSWRC
jgi:NAD(P)-dependent dehydrogenase (short-subunit alcohol dehydrogenase family)